MLPDGGMLGTLVHFRSGKLRLDVPAPPEGTALSRLLNRIVPVVPGETGVMLRSFAIFFCVLSGYYVLRPVREEIGTAIGQEGCSGYFWSCFS